MTAHVLPPNSYNPLVGASKRETYIENIPQEYSKPVMNSHGKNNDFDDLYDISEDEEEVTNIPITISISNSPITPGNEKPHPTLAIPDPSNWPSVQNFKKHVDPQPFNASLLSPRLTVPRAELARISSTQPSSSRTPSLDGSLTSDEMNSISCPSTPDVTHAEEDPQEWTLPEQLNPASLRTLGCLALPKSPEGQCFALQPTEMAERGADLNHLNTEFEIAMTPIEAGELSALSIPSPGGFFSSLDATTRFAWQPQSARPEDVPSTTAENFYTRPFDGSGGEPNALPISTQNIEVDVDDNNFTDGPPTARQIPAHWDCGTTGLQAFKSPDLSVPERVGDYNETYEKQLREQSSLNLDRTASWLVSQSYPSDSEVEIPSQTVKSQGIGLQHHTEPGYDPEPPPVPPKPDEDEDSTFLRGFEHLQYSQQLTDTFVHRKTRTEKLRLDRKCLFNTHVSQLEGKYVLKSPRSAKHTSDLDTVVEEDSSEKLAIETAVREQEALEQIEPASWAVEATKYLNGGTLLTSPVTKSFGHRSTRILDLGGVASCDWAWQVALEHPDATVHTVCLPDKPFNSTIATPKNHKQTVVPNLWTLPFPNGHFDAVSARYLHALLKLRRPTRHRSDEYDLTLRECMRVLRPGGYLEFAMLDSDIVSSGHLGQLSQTMNVEFTYNLKQRGYDPAPTKFFLARVRKAGFGQIRRAWLVLPMSQHSGNADVMGTTADASYIAGMVGAWAWERWLLKIQKEMGREESRLLEGVPAVMEEGAQTGAGWRYLSGWARKPC
jgi:Methyltransferase domain